MLTILAARTTRPWVFRDRPPHRGGHALPSLSVEAQNDADARAEVRDIDEELASLRAQVHDLRALAGAKNSGTVDMEENASEITSVEEQEALIEVLEDRRGRLLRRLEAQS